MAVGYATPGVYVVEESGGARPIQAVGSSTAAFVGRAPGLGAPVGEPKAFTDYSAFARVFLEGASEAGVFANAVAGFFANGGGRCYALNVGDRSGPLLSGDLTPLDGFEEISIFAAPGFADGDSYEALLSFCEARRGRFAILDAPEVEALESLTRATTAGGAAPRRADKEGSQGCAAVYTPWLKVRDAISGAEVVQQPPSGHLAGLYARTDALRGVHKAPANAGLAGVTGLTRRLSAADQTLLNPEGVNCLRVFSDGVRVWGARTLADPASEFRYVPVRRLMSMIALSLERGTRWVVFEPNDLKLWKSLRRDIGAFLHRLWRDGALAGATPEQAFFVKCDAETTTQADIDAGVVNAVIGVAPVRPAEFVVLRLGQHRDGEGGAA